MTIGSYGRWWRCSTALEQRIVWPEGKLVKHNWVQVCLGADDSREEGGRVEKEGKGQVWQLLRHRLAQSRAAQSRSVLLFHHWPEQDRKKWTASNDAPRRCGHYTALHWTSLLWTTLHFKLNCAKGQRHCLAAKDASSALSAWSKRGWKRRSEKASHTSSFSLWLIELGRKSFPTWL